MNEYVRQICSSTVGEQNADSKAHSSHRRIHWAIVVCCATVNSERTTIFLEQNGIIVCALCSVQSRIRHEGFGCDGVRHHYAVASSCLVAEHSSKSMCCCCIAMIRCVVGHMN